jgi:esterase/lipase
MRGSSILLSVILTQISFSQGVTPKDWGLKDFQIRDSELGNINYYVTERGIDQEKPLLFVISGCRGLPTMLVVECGDKSVQFGTVPPDHIEYFCKDHHVAFIGKAGTPFCDKMKVDQINPLKNLEDYQPSQEYIEKCGMEWEVKASSTVIDTLCEKLPIAENKVAAIGFSEGGHLAVKLAAENKKVTHLVSAVSNGLNQFYSSIINRRIDAATGEITHRKAQEEIEGLFAIYKEIYSDPRNTEKWYYGHPYRRWGSFCNDIPLEHLVELEIPILLVSGSSDRNSPILQTDYVMLEFLRLRKTNLTYRVFPGCDHWFNGIVLQDGKQKRVSHRSEAFKAISDWLASR